MTTGGQIVDQVLRRLEESTTVPIFYSRAEALVHLNDAILEFNLIAGKLNSERGLSLTTDNFYSVPATSPAIIAILRVDYGSKVLEKTSLESRDRAEPEWVSKTGTVKRWFPVGLNVLGINPHFAAGGESVTLTTLDVHAAVGEGTTINLEDQFMHALEEYVYHAMRFKEGGQEFAVSIPDYDGFLSSAGAAEEKTVAEQFASWSKIPNADTGPSYTTLGNK